MELKLINAKGADAGAVSAADTLFGREYNEALVHQLVKAFLANARQGTRAQKDREQVKHSTKKPFRQKGTGRARAGMTSSPLWRGGGRIFPNSPDENFTEKVNRKMYRAGMATILSKLAADGRLKVVDDFSVEAPKTKLMAAKIKDMGISNRVLIITPEIDDNLWLSSRNLHNVLVLEPHQADPWSLVRFDHVLLTRDAVKSFEEMYA
ncbi:MAG: 50S ribosomal protein L4 [Pseudomonadota bacterium]